VLARPLDEYAVLDEREVDVRRTAPGPDELPELGTPVSRDNGLITYVPLRPREHETNVGVMVSRDRGASWAPASAGLEQRGVPYRFVRTLALSPSFATDRTLFAWAWGPASLEDLPVGTGKRLSFENALFRSRDAGRSWQAVWDHPGIVTGVAGDFAQTLDLGFSPTFGEDGVMLAAVGQGLSVELSQIPSERLGEVTGQCTIWRSVDGGGTWTSVVSGTKIGPATERCVGVNALASGREWRAAASYGDADLPGELAWWRRSSDGELTWDSVPPPVKVDGARRILGGSALGALLATNNGLWLVDGPLGRDARQPVCPASGPPVAPGFGVGPPDVLERRGCPTGPAVTVRLLERQVYHTRAFWSDDASPFWFLLLRPGRDGMGPLAVRSKQDAPWTAAPDRVLTAAPQPSARDRAGDAGHPGAQHGPSDRASV
jgi:hypothetical protein